MVRKSSGSIKTGRRIALGLDYGTESARAVLVDVTNGAELATAEFAYTDGVIDKALPGSGKRLGHDWALQNPRDWLEALRVTVPKALKAAKVKPEDIIGIGLDFTACTVLPIDAKGEPLCFQKRWAKVPHAWVKLWKHHAAQPQADRLNAIARERAPKWLARYGGKVSSEWLFPKLAQICDEAPEVYEAADKFIEGADWIVLQLTGQEKRNACCAGYKATWDKEEGYPDAAMLKALHPMLDGVVEKKLSRNVYPVGAKAGELTAKAAEMMGLREGIPVGVAIIDAHAAVMGSGITGPGKMGFIMGTSGCHLLVGDEKKLVEGISGVVADGILPGYYGYEAGQAGFGDIYAWFVRNCAPHIKSPQSKSGYPSSDKAIHAALSQDAAKLKPGQSGLVALDWWNGNRSVLNDADLSGVLVGCTLTTTAAEIYRALIEATAFGTRKIIETFEKQGIKTDAIVASGGMPQKSPFLMQIFADVTGREFSVAASTQCSALGAAMLGAVVAGSAGGGYNSIVDAAKKMAKVLKKTYKPNKANHAIYSELYAEYELLHDYFGRGGNEVLKRLKKMRVGV